MTPITPDRSTADDLHEDHHEFDATSTESRSARVGRVVSALVIGSALSFGIAACSDDDIDVDVDTTEVEPDEDETGDLMEDEVEDLSDGDLVEGADGDDDGAAEGDE